MNSKHSVGTNSQPFLPMPLRLAAAVSIVLLLTSPLSLAQENRLRFSGSVVEPSCDVSISAVTGTRQGIQYLTVAPDVVIEISAARSGCAVKSAPFVVGYQQWPLSPVSASVEQPLTATRAGLVTLTYQ